jgi:hypothetical protein
MDLVGNHLTCPFGIMCTVSIPWIVLHAPSRGSEPLAGSNSPFDGTMILLHDFVELMYGPTLA